MWNIYSIFVETDKILWHLFYVQPLTTLLKQIAWLNLILSSVLYLT